MDHEAILKDLSRKFKAKADLRKGDWLLMQEVNGVYVGDCTNFARTLAHKLAGGSLWRFWWHQITCKSVIWHCKSKGRGVGHAVLWHRGVGWADNVIPRWRENCEHEKRLPYYGPLLLLKMAAARLN